MSSAFKTLKTSDVTVTPYVTNKSYTIRLDTENAEAYGFTFNYFNSGSSIGTGPDYDSNALYYRSIRHLYYSHYLPSLSPTTPLSEQDYSQLEEDEYGRRKTNNTLIYDNYLQSSAASGSSEVDDRFDFELQQVLTSGIGSVFSIPQSLYGECIAPNSFEAVWNNGAAIFIDDGNGNIVDTSATDLIVGNIIYAHGIIIMWRYNYDDILDPNNPTSTVISFKSTFTIYENQTRCHVNENEFNYTQNPTSTSGSNILDFAQGIGPVLSYTRSTSTGTITPGGSAILNAGQEMTDNVSIGFDFNLYGITYSTCSISSNGNIQFNSSYINTGYDTITIPTNTYPSIGPAIFAYLAGGKPGSYQLHTDTGDGGGYGIFTQTTGTPGSRIFNAEWKTYTEDDDYLQSKIGTQNFQIRLYESTNVIELIYGSCNNTYSSSIGIQRDINYYDVYSNNSSRVPTSGLLVRYTPNASSTYDFTPYVTTVGLYNAANQLLGVGKLSQPYPVPANTDITFVVKYDS